MVVLIIFVALQAVVILIVILVLRHLLKQELMQAAFEQLQGMPSVGNEQALIITSGTPLEEQVRKRIETMLRRKSPQAKIVFEQNAALQGGLVIAHDTATYDFSLSGRLKKLWV
jgi:F0F1-type ATP synthase delta subunit